MDEILRTCKAGAWFRVIGHVNNGAELVPQFSGRRGDGRPVDGLTNWNVRLLRTARDALYAVTTSGIFKTID